MPDHYGYTTNIILDYSPGQAYNQFVIMDRIRSYLKSIERKYARGDASEHTYRSSMEKLIEALGDNITATNEPKRIKCGAPDFIITKGIVPLGYIETKDIGKSLQAIETDARKKTPKTADGKQLKRYLGSLSNLIFTDYLEFRWFYNGEKRLVVRIARETDSGKIRFEKEKGDEFIKLIRAFLEAETVSIDSPIALAKKMASIAQLIHDIILGALSDDDKGGNLRDQMEAFRKVLIHDLTEGQFADMYAQTICYGLFTARYNHKGKEPFTREKATFELPKTNPFLRKMFGHIAGPELDDRVTWAVDDLAELLDKADIEAITRDFGKRTRREDPVVHFYESFLAAYDPKMRESRGVYYTPEPVVSFIVRSVDYILKNDFGLEDGLADSHKIDLCKNKKGKDGKTETVKKGKCHKVIILDPAVGTGTFLHGVIDHIHEHITNKGQGGTWSSYVSEHLLPRIFGFELLMAPYAVAHMKLGIQLEETGYDFKADERLNIYLTNTLEESFNAGDLPFANWIAAEANEAGKIKNEAPVMVILGNPPYSGHSANKGAWIRDLLRGKDSLTGEKTENYFEVDGKPLGERNPKWLNDDYVKFIRFSQWRIEQTGYGILAFITNHSYLDSPTFRGMRQSLMNTFDDIYILDLHGNAKKREKAPDGSKDENVFDIQQGVAIGIFVKRRITSKRSTVKKHSDLWGLREQFKNIKSQKPLLIGGKYYWLQENDISHKQFNRIESLYPSYLFKPQDRELLSEYNALWSIKGIMRVHVLGFQTHRDNFAIDFNHKTMIKHIRDLLNDEIENDEIAEKYGIEDSCNWQLGNARSKISDLRNWEKYIVNCTYRPFDERYCFFNSIVMDRPRRELVDHVFCKDNITILVPRQLAFTGWRHIFISKKVADSCAVSIKTKEGNHNFPLYLYPEPLKRDLFDSEKTANAPGGRKPNIAPEFTDEFSKKIKMAFVQDGKGDLKKTFGPEDVFSYIYAVFHSPAYRERYAEFLKIDFPRLPLTSKPVLFRNLCKLGDELVNLHLMEKTGPEITSYPIEGEHEVEKVRYTEPGQGADNGRVWINKEQYFENVRPEVWGFHIGGYQVCYKWLKDRKGRKLSYDDIKHYQNIVSILSETIRIMPAIDKLIDKHGGWPIN